MLVAIGNHQWAAMRLDAPSQQHFTVLKALAHLERDTDAAIDLPQAEECRAYAWAIAAPGDNQYSLRDAGAADSPVRRLSWKAKVMYSVLLVTKSSQRREPEVIIWLCAVPDRLRQTHRKP